MSEARSQDGPLRRESTAAVSLWESTRGLLTLRYSNVVRKYGPGAAHHDYYPKHRVYLLRDIIFCADCVSNLPDDVKDDTYGKMRPHTNTTVAERETSVATARKPQHMRRQSRRKS